MQAASRLITLNEGLLAVSAERCACGTLLRGSAPHCNIETEFGPCSRTVLVPLARMSGVECNSAVESFQHRLA